VNNVASNSIIQQEASADHVSVVVLTVAIKAIVIVLQQ